MPSDLLTSLGSGPYFGLAGVTDSNGGLTDLTNGGVVTFVAGKVGNGANFVAASSQKLTHADAAALDFTTKLSIAFWYKPATIGGTQVMVCKGTFGSTLEWAVQNTNTQNLAFYIGDTSAGISANVGFDTGPPDWLIQSFEASRWYHVVVVYDGTQTGNAARAKIYLNGILQPRAFTGTIPATNTVAAGGLCIGGLQTTQYTNGIVDELGLFPDALTQAQVLELYNAGSGIAYPLDVVSSATPYVYNFLGDSLTRGVKASASIQDYPNQLLALIADPLVTAAAQNFGVTNTGFNNWWLSTTAPVDAQYDAARQRNVLVVWCGRNDMSGGRTAAQTYADLKTFCLGRKSAGFTVVVLDAISGTDYSDVTRGTFNTSLAGDFTTTAGTNIKTGGAAYADMLVQLSGLSTIGVDAAFNDPTYYDADKIHLNDTGYAAVAALVNTGLGLLIVAPGAPTIGTAVRGNVSAQVPFTAPASNGNSAITSYTATSSPGGFTGTLSQAGSGTITVNGLTNGTAYTFTVHATNAVGNSSESSASNAVTPATTPGTPTIGTATVTDSTHASVAFTAPASTGGSAITGYTVTSTPGGFTGTGAASPITVTAAFVLAAAYTFTAHATNALGDSSESAASNAVTPSPSVTSSFSGGYGEQLDRDPFLYDRPPVDHVRRQRERFGIPQKTAEIIEAVAVKQSQDLSLDDEQRLEQVTQELEYQNVRVEATHLEFLNARREALINEEIARLMKRKLNNENAERILLLMAW